MDPAATIATYLATSKADTSTRHHLAQEVRAWYRTGGFHPMVEEVRDLLSRMVGGDDLLPNGWADDARTLGAR